MTSRPIGEDDLHAYVDGVLDGHRRAEVEAVLNAQPELRARVARDIEARDALRAALAGMADEPVPSELSLTHVIERRGRRDWRRWTLPLQGAAAAMLLVIGGAGGWMMHASQQQPTVGIAALAEEAKQSYAVYAPDAGRPVEIAASDAPQFVQWASRRLDRPVAVPDLSAAGYRFLGGRVVPTPHGAAVMFMYDNVAGQRLTLLSRNMAVDKEAPMAVDREGAVTTVSWARRGLGFSMVGTIDGAALHPIADAARAQLDKTI
ncbi:hypothetical protein DMC47_25360 [Nostoc sp. 3335mG]|nr:hypothetical protein DMC47_25360 [Nostoc sp. 3335mG]